MSSIERPITPEELGVGALPADATPAQKARAEAVWRQAKADEPCRCSGKCPHGQPCGDGCEGKTIHVDRYPGSLWSYTIWADDYACSEGCEEGYAGQVGPIELPDIPWGYPGEPYGTDGNRAICTYPGVRHPNYFDPDELEDDDSDED